MLDFKSCIEATQEFDNSKDYSEVYISLISYVKKILEAQHEEAGSIKVS